MSYLKFNHPHSITIIHRVFDLPDTSTFLTNLRRIDSQFCLCVIVSVVDSTLSVPVPLVMDLSVFRADVSKQRMFYKS